jgi:hypothetical protein
MFIFVTFQDFLLIVVRDLANVLNANNMIKIDPVTNKPLTLSSCSLSSDDIGHPNILHNYFSSGQSSCVKESSSSVISGYSSDFNSFEHLSQSRSSSYSSVNKFSVCHLCSVPGIDCFKPLFGDSQHKHR